LTINSTTKPRSYSGNSYYLPVADRPNLVIYNHSIAARVLFSEEKSRAIGVKFIQANLTKIINGKKEIILIVDIAHLPRKATDLVNSKELNFE
jgi:hypothetical protein